MKTSHKLNIHIKSYLFSQSVTYLKNIDNGKVKRSISAKRINDATFVFVLMLLHFSTATHELPAPGNGLGTIFSALPIPLCPIISITDQDIIIFRSSEVSLLTY